MRAPKPKKSAAKKSTFNMYDNAREARPIYIYLCKLLNNIEKLWYLARIFSMRIMGLPGSLSCDKFHKIAN